MSKKDFIKFVEQNCGEIIVNFTIESKGKVVPKSRVGLFIIAGFIIGNVIANKIIDHTRVGFTKVKSKDEQTAE